MNLMEHYIEEVYNVVDVTNKYEESVGNPSKEPVIKVNMRIDCYGRKEDTEKLFFLSEWEEAQKQGYYME